MYSDILENDEKIKIESLKKPGLILEEKSENIEPKLLEEKKYPYANPKGVQEEKLSASFSSFNDSNLHPSESSNLPNIIQYKSLNMDSLKEITIHSCTFINSTPTVSLSYRGNLLDLDEIFMKNQDFGFALSKYILKDLLDTDSKM